MLYTYHTVTYDGLCTKSNFNYMKEISRQREGRVFVQIIKAKLGSCCHYIWNVQRKHGESGLSTCTHIMGTQGSQCL